MTDGAGGAEGGGGMSIPSGGPYVWSGLYPIDWSDPYGNPIGSDGTTGDGTTMTLLPNAEGTNGRCGIGRGLKGSGAYIRMNGDGVGGRGLTCPWWCPSLCPGRVSSA